MRIINELNTLEQIKIRKGPRYDYCLRAQQLGNL